MGKCEEMQPWQTQGMNSFRTTVEHSWSTTASPMLSVKFSAARVTAGDCAREATSRALLD